MSFTAANVLSDVRRILQDASSDRWTDANLLVWLNEGQLKIISILPSSLAGYYTHALSHGVSQALSSTYYTLLNVVCNLTGSGDRGSAITRVDEEQMNIEDASWATDTPSATVLHWMQREDEDGTFRIYPPQPDGTSASVLVRACPYPTTVVSTSAASEFSDEYRQVLVDYIAYRAFTEDQANEVNDAASQKHFTLFNEQLGLYK